MSPTQQSISSSLEQLRRAPWPEAIADFEGAAPVEPLEPNAQLERLTQLQMRADRWTCRASTADIRAALVSGKTRPILVHAIDADLAIPMLASWTRLHLKLLLWLARSLRNTVRLVLPDDWPGSKRELKGESVDWVDAKYPAGHWRMLPHVMGRQRENPLVLDAVAGVEVATCLAGHASDSLPIAVCDLDRSSPVRFTLAKRDATLRSVLTFEEHTRWIAGPRWRRREAIADQVLNEGELVFYADRERPQRQSPCIRCGWCEYICPTRCSPAEFIKAQHPLDMAKAERAGLSSCIECGLCTNVCPSNLPLYGFIHQLHRAQEGRR